MLRIRMLLFLLASATLYWCWWSWTWPLAKSTPAMMSHQIIGVQPRGYIGNLEQLHSSPLQTARSLQSTKYINAKHAKHKWTVPWKNYLAVQCTVDTQITGAGPSNFLWNEIKNLTFVWIVFPRFAEHISYGRDFDESLKIVSLQFPSSQTRNI